MAAIRPATRAPSGNIAWYPGLRVGDLPPEAARRWAGKEALSFRGRRFTFGELDARIERLARAFLALGVEPGEKVCLWLNNCPEWIDCLFALARIGAVMVPANTRFRTRDVAWLLEHSESATLVVQERSGPVEFLAMVGELLPPECRGDGGFIASDRFPALRRLLVLPGEGATGAGARAPFRGARAWEEVHRGADRIDGGALARREAGVSATDTLFIMYTSGTTGLPKGVMRHHGLLRNQEDRIARLGSTQADVILNYLPLFHIFGYVDGPLLSMMTGARQVLTPTFDPEQALDLVASEGVTQMQGFETHLKALVDAQRARPREISSLRAGVFAGGMRSAVPVLREAGRVLAPLRTLTAYGMTEIGANAALSFLDSSEEQRTESSGYPCPGFELRIVDPATGEALPPGQEGEILVRTYNLMQGYYRMPEETAAALDGEGWFHTGDMGCLRSDGYLRFLGRYKDMLKVGGENVDPMEVEGLLLEHPDVLQAAVVGAPDPRLTEVPVAFVVVRNPGPGAPMASAALETALIDGCRGRIASFKVPRRIFVREHLPMTSTGKIRKHLLRAEARELVAAAPARTS